MLSSKRLPKSHQTFSNFYAKVLTDELIQRPALRGIGDGPEHLSIGSINPYTSSPYSNAHNHDTLFMAFMLSGACSTVHATFGSAGSSFTYSVTVLAWLCI